MKTVRFLRDDHVHRVGEKPFTYVEGSIHSLRDDRADFRIQNGIAVEVKPEPSKQIDSTVETPPRFQKRAEKSK